MFMMLIHIAYDAQNTEYQSFSIRNGQKWLNPIASELAQNTEYRIFLSMCVYECGRECIHVYVCVSICVGAIMHVCECVRACVRACVEL